MADGDIPISPGAGVGIFFVLLILISTLIIWYLRRRTQNKLYNSALENDPYLTRAGFRAQQKADWERGHAAEINYELGKREEKRLKKQRKKMAKNMRKEERTAYGGVMGEPTRGDGDSPGGSIEQAVHRLPYTPGWREEQAPLVQEPIRDATFERYGGLVAGSWARHVQAEMDIGLQRNSSADISAQNPVLPSLTENAVVEVPQRVGPPTRRPVGIENEDLPSYTPEVLPPYVKDVRNNP